MWGWGGGWQEMLATSPAPASAPTLSLPACKLRHILGAPLASVSPKV